MSAGNTREADLRAHICSAFPYMEIKVFPEMEIKVFPNTETKIFLNIEIKASSNTETNVFSNMEINEFCKHGFKVCFQMWKPKYFQIWRPKCFQIWKPKYFQIWKPIIVLPNMETKVEQKMELDFCTHVIHGLSKHGNWGGFFGLLSCYGNLSSTGHPKFAHIHISILIHQLWRIT